MSLTTLRLKSLHTIVLQTMAKNSRQRAQFFPWPWPWPPGWRIAYGRGRMAYGRGPQWELLVLPVIVLSNKVIIIIIIICL